MRWRLQWLAPLFIILSSTAFALPCPNGSGILYKGDTIARVIHQCGKPDKEERATRVLYTADEWIYYRPHFYDTGYAQLIIRFNNDFVSSIYINNRYPYLICQRNIIQLGVLATVQTSCGDFGYYTAYTNLCGWPIGLGTSKQLVAANCGTPAAATPLANQIIETTNLVYGGQTIVFENGKLVDFE